MQAAKRMYFVLLGLVGLAMVALVLCTYWATGILKSKSLAVAKAKQQTMVIEEKQNKLRKAKADIAKYEDLAQIAKGIVPQDKDQAQTVREISNLAAQNNVMLGSITFPASSLGDAKTTPHTQLTPAPGIPGVYVLPISVRSDAKLSSSLTNFVHLLEALEHNRRTALVTSIDLQPDVKKPGSLFFALTIEEYIKP